MKDVLSSKKLWRKYIHNEKLIDYQEGIDFIQSNNYQVRGIVCDGFKGLFKQFVGFNVQMCQRHQIDIVRRYLTRYPKLPAGKELYFLTKNITKLSEKESKITIHQFCLNTIKEMEEGTPDFDITFFNNLQSSKIQMFINFASPFWVAQTKKV
jgi:hypothetical protein